MQTSFIAHGYVVFGSPLIAQAATLDLIPLNKAMYKTSMSVIGPAIKQ